MTDLEYTTIVRSDVTRVPLGQHLPKREASALTQRVLGTAGRFEAVRVTVPSGTNPNKLANSLRARIFSATKRRPLGGRFKPHTVLSADKRYVQMWLD